MTTPQDEPRRHASGTAPGHRSVRALRCWRCQRKLAELVTAPWLLVCPRCKATNASHDVTGGAPEDDAAG
jgi:phage FluMu protein Com